MSFLLDTNICSYHLRRPVGLTHRFVQHSGRLFISTIAAAELYAWAYCRDDPEPILESLREFFRLEVKVLDFDADCAHRFGQLRGILTRRGIAVSPPDLMIPSVALVHDFTLVTHNTADFENIPDLRLEDWIEP